jgi:hypothetical protein
VALAIQEWLPLHPGTKDTQGGSGGAGFRGRRSNRRCTNCPSLWTSSWLGTSSSSAVDLAPDPYCKTSQQKLEEIARLLEESELWGVPPLFAHVSFLIMPRRARQPKRLPATVWVRLDRPKGQGVALHPDYSSPIFARTILGAPGESIIKIYGLNKEHLQEIRDVLRQDKRDL